MRKWNFIVTDKEEKCFPSLYQTPAVLLTLFCFPGYVSNWCMQIHHHVLVLKDKPLSSFQLLTTVSLFISRNNTLDTMFLSLSAPSDPQVFISSPPIFQLHCHFHRHRSQFFSVLTLFHYGTLVYECAESPQDPAHPKPLRMFPGLPARHWLKNRFVPWRLLRSLLSPTYCCFKELLSLAFMLMFGFPVRREGSRIYKPCFHLKCPGLSDRQFTYLIVIEVSFSGGKSGNYHSS